MTTVKWGEKNMKRNGPTNGAPEDLSRSAEVDGTMRRLGVHALTEKPQVLHLLSHKPTRHTYLLAPNNHNFLAVQELLSNDRCQTPKHVVSRVHHYHLRADS